MKNHKLKGGKIEKAAVNAYKKIEKAFVEAFLEEVKDEKGTLKSQDRTS